MAEPVHFTLSPGVTKSLAEALTLSVDAPTDSDKGTTVIVQLFETDVWPLDFGKSVKERDKAGFQIFGHLEGRVENKKFLVTKVVTDNKPSPDLPNVRIKIDGDASGKVLEFPVQLAVDEPEGGYLEINMAVQCSVGGKFFGYASPQVFVRNIPQRRPVIAFITDRDRRDDPNQFFAEAKRFFLQFADQVVDQPTPMALTDIFETLRGDANQDPDLKKKWGEINIITHANAEDWFIRAEQGDEQKLTADDVNNLTGLRRPALLATLNKVVDRNTLVVLRGCQAGKNQPLLDAVGKLFTGDVGGVTVLSPRFIQNYEHGSRAPAPKPKKGRRPPPNPAEADQSREFFEDVFDLIFKGNVKTPAIAQCKTEILKDPANKDKDLTALKIHKSKLERDVRPIDLASANQRTLINPKTDAEFERFTRAVDKKFPDDSEGFGSWHASLVRKDRQGVVLSYTLTGFRRLVDCREPLLRQRRKPGGGVEMVAPVPDITNPLDYGRSPEFILGD